MLTNFPKGFSDGAGMGGGVSISFFGINYQGIGPGGGGGKTETLEANAPGGSGNRVWGLFFPGTREPV